MTLKKVSGGRRSVLNEPEEEPASGQTYEFTFICRWLFVSHEGHHFENYQAGRFKNTVNICALKFHFSSAL